MTEIILARGLPGSGKSTHAKQWVEESKDTRATISRDDIRLRLFGEWYPTENRKYKENKVTDFQHAFNRGDGFDLFLSGRVFQRREIGSWNLDFGFTFSDHNRGQWCGTFGDCISDFGMGNYPQSDGRFGSQFTDADPSSTCIKKTDFNCSEGKSFGRCRVGFGQIPPGLFDLVFNRNISLPVVFWI
jgi:hypothetical protein